MAAGDTKIMSDSILKEKNGEYSSSDTWRIVFLSDEYADIDTTDTDPVLTDYTAVSGGNFSAAYTLSSKTLTRSGAVITFDSADIGTIDKDGSNPAIKTAALVNDTVDSDVFQVWDLTADGTTAVDTVNNDFTFNFGSDGINEVTNTSTS